MISFSSFLHKGFRVDLVDNNIKERNQDETGLDNVLLATDCWMLSILLSIVIPDLGSIILFNTVENYEQCGCYIPDSKFLSVCVS